MKKSLLAVAAIGAFASAAQAQSSVTVYGILDVGFVQSNYNGTSVSNNLASAGNSTLTGNATQKQSTAGIGQSAESTSRIGFKGSEDLGGGLSGIFTIELSFDPNGQGATSTGTVSAWGQVNRQSFAGLKKNGLGAVTLGTQYTPVFDLNAATDAAGLNNLVGNAVYSGSLQSGTGTFNQGTGPFAGATKDISVNALSGAYTTRTSNAMKLQSDRFAGLAGQLFYAQSSASSTISGTQFANAAATTQGGVNNNTAWGVGADYEWNKLKVVAAYQNIKSYDPSAAASVVLATPAGVTISNGTALNFGTNMTDNQTYAAAVYDFGILKAYYQYSARKASAVTDSSYYTKRSANQIGVRSQLTPTISAYATYGLGNASYFGQGLTGANFRTSQIGVDYYLSKRTNLYAAWGTVNQSSNGSTSGSTVAAQSQAGGVGTSANNTAVGIRHTF